MGTSISPNASTSGTDAAIYKVLAVGGTIPASPTIQTISTAIKGVTGIAIDPSGNLFASDQATSAIYELMAVNGSIPASPVIRNLGSGFSLPANIALDAAGDVFVPDFGNHAVYEMLAVNGSIPAGNPTILKLGSGFSLPAGLAVDQSGNVFVADEGLPQAVEIAFATPPSLTFAQTAVGQTSSDSPKAVTLANDGNAALVFSGLSGFGGKSLSITNGFTIAPGSTCPQVMSPATAQLAAGATCFIAVDFTPVYAGNIYGELDFNQNAPTHYKSQPSVALNGIAVDLATTLTFSVANQVFGTPPFTVAATSNSPGAITYSVVSGPATISGATVTLTGTGTVALLASQAASGAYTAATATATFTVSKQQQTITFAALASPVASNAPPMTLVATASSGLPVSFSLVSGPGAVNGNGLTIAGSGTIVVAASQAGNAQYAAAPTVTQIVVVDPVLPLAVYASPNPVFINNPVTLTAILSGVVGPPATGTMTFFDGTQVIGTATLNNTVATLSVSTLSLGTHAIGASYGGNAYWAPTVSAPVSVVVEDFSLTLANPSVTIDHGGTGTFLLNISATSGASLAGPVSLTVTGAPDGSAVKLSQPSIASGSGSTPVTLTIQTPNYPTGPWQVGSLRGYGTPVAALLLAGVLLPRRRRRICAILLATLVLAGLSGCGSGWKAQEWTINITASSGQLTHNVKATLNSVCADGQSACPVVHP